MKRYRIIIYDDVYHWEFGTTRYGVFRDNKESVVKYIKNKVKRLEKIFGGLEYIFYYEDMQRDIDEPYLLDANKEDNLDVFLDKVIAAMENSKSVNFIITFRGAHFRVTISEEEKKKRKESV